MKEKSAALLKQLPSVDRISRTSLIKELLSRYPRKLVLYEIRENLKKIREAIVNDGEYPKLDLDTVTQYIVEKSRPKLNNSLKRGINGAGVILHTGMGRAPFAKEAQQALLDSVMNYCTVQIDQDTGKRGHRDSHIENLIQQITGAEAATIVNNNAAATMLVLNTLAKDKEVVVSRGQLVEIGGAFRIPDVMKQSGAILHEVGTTNRTHLKDYAGAIRSEEDEIQTGCLLHVHTSNYYIRGFTKTVPIKEMAELAHSKGLPMYDDLGSGALIDLERFGLPHEPTIQESLEDGADVISFSGDKLVGGPQCGIIVGKKEYIEKIRKNQLSRSLRCDKMTYAVLEATLRLFLDEEKLLKRHPVIKMLTESNEEVKKRGQSLQRRIKSSIGNKVRMRLEEDVSEVGSGSLSWANIPTHVLTFKSSKKSAEAIAEGMRKFNPPIYGRINNDCFIIDCRTILHEEIGFIIKAAENTFKN